ncbi:hypothetical protein [Dysgonomonas termitidis]|uniref:Uncharacterized protein n=1 Tax=Dysgonomonas termitidis TaxID=1516126 RepID=A0ABV9KU09_9BACT
MNKFLVRFPCKSYVSRFLELKFGEPDSSDLPPSVDLSSDKGLYEEFRERLSKRSYRHEKKYDKYLFKRYSDEINIRISQDDFYRYGWELSKTDIVRLNCILEGRAKILMYSFVGMHRATGTSLSESIDLFQEKFMFPEDVWPKESIYKSCQRNLDVDKNYVIKELAELINKITLATLSEKKDNVAGTKTT